jgi:VanZ family protein
VKFFENKSGWVPFLPSIAVSLVVFWLSVTPGIQMPDVGLSLDKLGHFSAYGLLSWLVLKALYQTGRWSCRLVLSAIGLVVIYGIALEFVQWGFFPYRFFEVWDMIANIIGTICTISSYFAFKIIITKTKRHGF